MPEDTPVQPKLADLLAGYLQRQAQSQAAGLAGVDAGAEVVPYEAGPVHPVDPRLAWDETLVVARCYAPNLKAQDWHIPPTWPALVAAHEPVVALACALGNFPQMVRHFHTILQSRNLAQLRPASVRPASAPAVAQWARQIAQNVAGPDSVPQLLGALGTLRLAKEFDEAEKILQAQDANVPAAWRTAWDNEKAALAWHRGQTQLASQQWQKLEPTAVVLFNRGMSELFLERPLPAQSFLQAAVARLPEEGAWHHLGRLYLALSQTR